jgi:hypothetical protein
MLGNSWVAAQLAASQEVLSSMSEWVNIIQQIISELLGFGLCPLSRILKTRKHDVSKTGSVAFLRWGGRHLPWWVHRKELTSITQTNYLISYYIYICFILISCGQTFHNCGLMPWTITKQGKLIILGTFFMWSNEKNILAVTGNITNPPCETKFTLKALKTSVTLHVCLHAKIVLYHSQHVSIFWRPQMSADQSDAV